MKNTPVSKERVFENIINLDSASKDTNNASNSAPEYSLEARTSKVLHISDVLPYVLKHLQPEGGGNE